MISMFRRIWTLIGKEFAAILRDPKSRFVVVGPPLIQFFIYGYAATFDLTDVRYAVLDESRSVESRALLARFEGSRTFELAATLNAAQEIDSVIDPQHVRLVLHIPQDFSDRIHSDEPAPLRVILDGRNSNVAAIASGYVATIVDQHNRSLAGDNGATARPSIELIDRAWFNENLLSQWYIVAALGGVISMVVVTILASLSVAREREFGTFDQLLVAPFRSGEILIGKAMPPMILGLADALLLSAGAVFWFGVPFRGSLLALGVVLIVFIIAVSGVGLFISSLSTTMQQALIGSFLFMMPAVILSGFITPIANMPMWLQYGTLINPPRYVMVALRGVFLEGSRMADIWPQLWPMAIIAMFTLTAATWLFRHRAQ